MLSESDKQDYIKNPNHCPYCQSDNISIIETRGEWNQLWQDIQCDDCKKTWSETYVLTMVEELSELEEESDEEYQYRLGKTNLNSENTQGENHDSRTV